MRVTRSAASRLAISFGAAVLIAAAPRSSSDEISWVRKDGTPGWSTVIAKEAHSEGGASRPLDAPVWFAKFPAVTMKLAPSGSFEIASARGKVVLVDYWASWCAPCIQELPHLQKLHESRSEKGFVALAVNADQGPDAAAASAKKLGLSMMIGVNDTKVYRDLGVRTLPTIFIIDKEGRTRAHWDGYRPGLENDIAATVDKLLADDATGTTREVAQVLQGQGKLGVRWSRDLAGSADGVVGVSAGQDGGLRVVASGGGELVSFDPQGEVIARLKVSGTAGRLEPFGASADGSREIVGYRRGGTSLDVISLRSGAERAVGSPAPVLDVAVQAEFPGDARRIALATVGGAALVGASGQRAAPIDGAAGVRSLAALPGRGFLGLDEHGAIGGLDPSTPAWSQTADGAQGMLAAREGGAFVGGAGVLTAASGRFLEGGGRQLAVATYAGHLVLLDEATGSVMFDAAWSELHDLAAKDLDGDGRDELLVASGRSVTALGAASP